MEALNSEKLNPLKKDALELLEVLVERFKLPESEITVSEDNISEIAAFLGKSLSQINKSHTLGILLGDSINKLSNITHELELNNDPNHKNWTLLCQTLNWARNFLAKPEQFPRELLRDIHLKIFGNLKEYRILSEELNGDGDTELVVQKYLCNIKESLRNLQWDNKQTIKDGLLQAMPFLEREQVEFNTEGWNKLLTHLHIEFKSWISSMENTENPEIKPRDIYKRTFDVWFENLSWNFSKLVNTIYSFGQALKVNPSAFKDIFSRTYPAVEFFANRFERMSDILAVKIQNIPKEHLLEWKQVMEEYNSKFREISSISLNEIKFMVNNERMNRIESWYLETDLSCLVEYMGMIENLIEMKLQFDFPVAQAEDKVETISDPRILVVEDDRMANLKLKKIFQRIGIADRVDFFSIGTDAYLSLMTMKYGAAFVDGSVPGVSSNTMSNEFSHIPFVTISADENSPGKFMFHANKPFTPQKIARGLNMSYFKGLEKNDANIELALNCVELINS